MGLSKVTLGVSCQGNLIPCPWVQMGPSFRSLGPSLALLLRGCFPICERRGSANMVLAIAFHSHPRLTLGRDPPRLGEPGALSSKDGDSFPPTLPPLILCSPSHWLTSDHL